MRKTLIAATLAAITTLGLAAPAFAIDRAPCWPENGQTKLSYRVGTSPATECFVNAGSVSVNMPGIYVVKGGNNNGNVEFIDNDGTTRFRPFSRGETTYLDYLRVTRVTIY